MYKVVVSQFESYIFDRSSILFYNRVMNKPKRPRDPNQLAKLIVDIATGEAITPENEPSKKNPAAVALGRLGGGKREGRLVQKSPLLSRGRILRRKPPKKDGNIKNNQYR